MALKEYKAKRNFRQTREPRGTGATPKGEPANFFVIQKHDATRLHYDFRLALDGVLKSWAVPKGFPSSKGDRRLAVEVEDHPMDYARFEGTIPRGNYGAGTVMVWDLGTYEVQGEDPRRGLKDGKLHFILQGKKLKGEWALVRMKLRPGEDKPQWLLFKAGADAKPVSARADDRSVLTQRSLRQIALDNDAQWQSDRIAARSAAQSGTQQPRSARLRSTESKSSTRRVAAAKRSPTKRDASALIPSGKLPRRKAEFVEPMKALLSEHLPRGESWLYELKFDGYRGLAIRDKRGFRLLSRNQKDLTAAYPEIVEALDQLPIREAILDGEIVALDSEGRPTFQLLQAANLPGEKRPPIYFYVFDVIQLEGRDLTGLPLERRKAVAEAVLKGAPGRLRFSSGIDGESERVLKAMKARGLEGLIAKRRDSKYEIGRRSGAWIKFKWTSEQEFVIGGYTPPQGTRSRFGAILVGVYEKGKLRFTSKVGTGFSQKLLESLYQKFQKIRRSDCPFVNLPEPRSSNRWGRALTLSEMKRCTWVEPRLVCEVRFSEWTRDGHLRHPAFLGLREDKDPREVVREQGPSES